MERRHEPALESAGGVSQHFAIRMKDLSPRGAVAVGILKQPLGVSLLPQRWSLVDHHTGLPVTILAFACFTVISTATVGWIYLRYARSPADPGTRWSSCSSA